MIQISVFDSCIDAISKIDPDINIVIGYLDEKPSRPGTGSAWTVEYDPEKERFQAYMRISCGNKIHFTTFDIIMIAATIIYLKRLPKWKMLKKLKYSDEFYPPKFSSSSDADFRAIKKIADDEIVPLVDPSLYSKEENDPIQLNNGITM